MPPASPVPGWSSGDVCTLIIATRRTASASVNRTTYLLEDPAPRAPTRCNRRPRPGIPVVAGPSQRVALGVAARWVSPAPETRPHTAPKTPSTRLGSETDWWITPNPPPHQGRQREADEDAQGQEVTADEP